MKKTFSLLLFFFCAYTIQQVAAADSLDIVIIFANDAEANRWNRLLNHPREVEISYPSTARLWRFPIRPLRFTINGTEYTVPLNNAAQAIGVIGERSDAIGVSNNALCQMPALDEIKYGNSINLLPQLTTLPELDAPFLPQQQIMPQKDVKIYILDTGIELQGAEPKNELLKRYTDMTFAKDFVYDTDLPNDDHFNGHGTGVAGIVVRYLTYLNPNSGKNIKIVPIKVLNAEGSGTTFNVIKAIDKATRENATLIHCSLAIKKSILSFSKKLPLQVAIERAQDAHILLIAGAGNNHRDLEYRKYYPAALPNDNIISVGASKFKSGQYVKACFSNWGKVSADVFAPGVHIRTIGTGNRPAFIIASGTSFSAPIVTGLAALLIAQGNRNDFLEVKTHIMNTATPISALNGKCVTGGIINVPNALR
jgi:Subtilase family